MFWNQGIVRAIFVVRHCTMSLDRTHVSRPRRYLSHRWGNSCFRDGFTAVSVRGNRCTGQQRIPLLTEVASAWLARRANCSTVDSAQIAPCFQRLREESIGNSNLFLAASYFWLKSWLFLEPPLRRRVTATILSHSTLKPSNSLENQSHFLSPVEARALNRKLPVSFRNPTNSSQKKF